MNVESTQYLQTTSNLIHVLFWLLIVGIGYAWLVRYLRRRSPDHGYTAFLVVAGNLLVATGFAFVAGAQMAVLLVLCMGAAGVPMIVEYVDDHLRDEKKKEVSTSDGLQAAGQQPQAQKLGRRRFSAG